MKRKSSDGLDVSRLLALLAHRYVEGDLLAFCERTEAVGTNFGEVGKQVFATIILSDEAETLCIVEPLDGTSSHFFNTYKIKKAHVTEQVKLELEYWQELGLTRIISACAARVTILTALRYKSSILGWKGHKHFRSIPFPGWICRI